MWQAAGKEISSILRHDQKENTYKIALVRAINDVALAFPDLPPDRDIAIPLRKLAEYWLAYYWPFVDRDRPIWQGKRQKQGEKLRQDMAFREELTHFRQLWETEIQNPSRPSDGFYIISEMRAKRRHKNYSEEFPTFYENTLTEISKSIQMPIRYAGPKGEQWSVFTKPTRYSKLGDSVVAIPGTIPKNKCTVVRRHLWQSFCELSLWVEALCLHEWCLFGEKIAQKQNQSVDRGEIYRRLTDRPDNRQQPTWERNQIDILLMEGKQFVCPWTKKAIEQGVRYDLDHILPISAYPVNELWNLVPADPKFNSHTKRHYLPSLDRLHQARPHLERAYKLYSSSETLSQALHEDAIVRFFALQRVDRLDFSQQLTEAVIYWVDAIAESRNLERF